MKRDWRKFLKLVETEPKQFARAMIDTLCPPKYVKEGLQKLYWICYYCWDLSVDECFMCEKRICQNHLKETHTGKKSKAEWHVCENCLKTIPKEVILEMIEDEDESLWNGNDYD